MTAKATDDKALSAPLSPDDDVRFGFGANWAAYVRDHFSDERVDISQKHMLRVLKLSDLKGRTFLDIGCGSGLHSLAAWRAGADRVVSFDFDGDSVRTAQYLHRMNGSPANWTIQQGSVLDRAFIDILPKSDIVYSWGVLHHTGSMWTAFTNAASRINPDGTFYVALYSSDVFTNPPASYWLQVKRDYNRAGRLRKRWMEWCYAWNHSIRDDLRAMRNPMIHIREYKKSRGMSFWHDVRDWLGGYPMEYAGHRETRERAAGLGLELVFIKAGEANTEFVFRPAGTRNYWDARLADSPLQDLPAPFARVDGHAWRASVPAGALGAPAHLMLYENGVPLGWPNQAADTVAQWGGGRYGVDAEGLVFSPEDGGDPNDGRRYQFRRDFA